MRENWLSNRIFKSFDDIVDHCCEAWNKRLGLQVLIIESWDKSPRNAAAAQGVVPRQLEFRRNENRIKHLQKSDVQVGLEVGIHRPLRRPSREREI